MVKTLEVERLVKGTKVVLRKEITEEDEVAAVVKELTSELNEALGVPAIENIASVAPQFPLQDGLAPAPQLLGDMSELPVLINPPHTYSPADAVTEVLNPQTSLWAKQPKTVKEIQQRLMELGVRGIGNPQTFDGLMRRLLSQGKVKRERAEKGPYRYYIK